MMFGARVTRWTLFLALLWTWPFPLLGLEGMFAPTARFIQLASSLSVLVALEGTGGMVVSLLVLLWTHVLVYSLILFAATSMLVRYALTRFPDRVRTGMTIAAVVALVGWATFGGPYDTMFHHSDAHASLLELYR